MSEQLESAKLIINREWVSDTYVVLSMLSGPILFSTIIIIVIIIIIIIVLIDVPFKVIFLELNILGAGMDLC